MKSREGAAKLSIYQAFFILAATIIPGVQSVTWSVGQDLDGSPFINRFEEWETGNPRRVAYTTDFNIDTSNLGMICGAMWLQSKEGGNVPQGSFDFNCVTTANQISSNEWNFGFYVGGLNCNGVTIAQCYMLGDIHTQACDSDVNSNNDCLGYIRCK